MFDILVNRCCEFFSLLSPEREKRREPNDIIMESSSYTDNIFFLIMVLLISSKVNNDEYPTEKLQLSKIQLWMGLFKMFLKN